MERFVWNKLITGGFRVGVSHSLVVRALSQASGIDEAAMAHRLSGAWEPRPDAFAHLMSHETRDAVVSRPYPFFLAHALEGGPETLGRIAIDRAVRCQDDGVPPLCAVDADVTFPDVRRHETGVAFERIAIPSFDC